MRRILAEEILASFPEDGVVFRYFKDRYALQLLAYAAAEGRSLSEMRRGRFRPLLQKPTVRRILGQRGGRGVDWDLLDSCFPQPTEDYHVTLALWGDDRDSTWYQTSRPGWNVVLQLNFPEAHDRAYRRYVGPIDGDPFAWKCHPIHRRGRHTLAWARLDVDWKLGEALIEEIQSDWIRDAEFAGREALELLVGGESDPVCFPEARCDTLQLYRYVEYVLANHRRLWDEAVLAASLWLLRERLGIHKIYMHTFEGGCRLKRMERWAPPRSLYEEVPRSFCFERAARAPQILADRLSRAPALSRCEFWYLRI